VQKKEQKNAAKSTVVLLRRSLCLRILRLLSGGLGKLITGRTPETRHQAANARVGRLRNTDAAQNRCGRTGRKDPQGAL